MWFRLPLVPEIVSVYLPDGVVESIVTLRITTLSVSMVTSVHIAETLDSTFRVFSASCNPGCTGLDLSAGTADITAARGVEKSVSFTNEATGP